jgi:hypothetical protein
MNTNDVLLPGEHYTYVSDTIERAGAWYVVRYGVADSRGEYFHGRKFYDMVEAIEWRNSVRELVA